MSEEELDKTIQQFGLEKQYITADVFLRTDEDRANHTKLMNLYWLSNDINAKLPFMVGKAELDTVIGKYKVGSILNAPQVTAQTPALWDELVPQVQKVSMDEVNIPTVYGLDQVHGATYSKGGTLFPNNINMAATFNPELAYMMGEIVAYETRACDVPWIFDPVVDLGRNQAWSRQYEGFGEDAYLSSVMGVAVVKGMQGPDPNHIDKYHVASWPKHFFAYGATYNGLDRSPAYLPYEELRGQQL